jgi:hypothetical protein
MSFPAITGKHIGKWFRDVCAGLAPASAPAENTNKTTTTQTRNLRPGTGLSWSVRVKVSFS